jgi:hypothetical protein
MTDMHGASFTDVEMRFSIRSEVERAAETGKGLFPSTLVGLLVARFPASTERVSKPGGCK